MSRNSQLLIIILLSLLLFIGCSSKNQIAGTTSEASSSPEAQLYCSPVYSTDLTGMVKLGTDAYGQFNPDTVTVQFNNVGSNFSVANNSTLQITAWGFQYTSGPAIRSQPLNFHVEEQGQAITQDATSLSAASVSGLLSQVGATSIAEFFANTDLTVSGLTNMQYKALSFTIYNNGNEESSVDALIPYYDANPDTYGSTHDLSLDQLHPFWNKRGQSEDWATMAKQLCGY